MRQLAAVLALSLLASVVVFQSATMASQTTCTNGDVQKLTNAGFQAAKLQSSAWTDCQFRLYDDNDDLEDPFFGSNVDNPEVPHVFSDQDYFLAGIFQFTSEDDLEAFDISRSEAIEFLTQIEERVFWGPKGGPLVEIALTQTNYRNTNNKDFLGWMVGNHRYHIFAPGSVSPGEYEWRWESNHPVFGLFVAHGEVTVDG